MNLIYIPKGEHHHQNGLHYNIPTFLIDNVVLFDILNSQALEMKG